MAAGVANAPCSWGIVGGGGGAVPYAQMLDELKAAGYAGTELGDYGYFPTDAELLYDELASRDLALLGGFFAGDLTSTGALARLRAGALAVASLLADVGGVADALRAPLFILADDGTGSSERGRLAGRTRVGEELSAETSAVVARNAREIASLVSGETGLKTAFHHHGGSHVETPREIDRLLASVDAGLLGLVFDTGHFMFGSGMYGSGEAAGNGALEGLHRLWDRVWYVHFKDLDAEVAAKARQRGWSYAEAVRNGVFCELGQGNIDFAGIVSLLGERGYSDWITVEQDVLPNMGDPALSARRNREYLTSLGL